jgi:predicted dehydrogenase
MGTVYLLRTWECYTDAPAVNWGLGELEPAPELVSDSWRASPSLLQGGALIDGGFHAVYRLLHLAAGKPIAVAALMGQFHPGLDWAAEDTAALLVHFDDGAIGQVTISYAFDNPGLGADSLFSVVGREGLLGGNQHSLFLRHAGWSEPSVARLATLEGDAAWQASIGAEIGHFLECMVDRRAPIAGVAEGRQALAVVRAAYESTATGHVVRLTPLEPLS